jgi:hypothetical protein
MVHITTACAFKSNTMLGKGSIKKIIIIHMAHIPTPCAFNSDIIVFHNHVHLTVILGCGSYYNTVYI